MELFRSADYIAIKSKAQNLQKSSSVLEVNKHRLKYFSGIGLGTQGIMSGSLTDLRTTDSSPNNISDLQGEWIAITEHKKRNGSSFLVFSDSYGYAPVFYSLIPGVAVIVLDTFQGVVAGRQQYGTSCTLNVPSYVTTVGGLGGHFANSISEQTMANEIQILHSEATLNVTSSYASLSPRTLISPAASISKPDEAVRVGVRQIISSLSQLASLPASKVLNLSGGVDSRLVLGLLMGASGEAIDTFQVLSSDPRAWKSRASRKIIHRDITIANELVRRFGLKWWEPPKKEKRALSFFESLTMFQSLRSNYSYTFSPSATLLGNKTPVISLRGGGGELLRGTSEATNLTATYKRTAKSNESLEAWYAEERLRKSYLTDNAKKISADLIRNNLAKAEGTTVEEKLNHIYFTGRNRAHFGHTRLSYLQHELPIHVLSSAYLLQASRLIDFGSKKNGALVKNIFCQTREELLDLPFENPTWTNKLSNSNDVVFDENDESWTEAMDRIRDANNSARYAPGWEINARSRYTQYNGPDSSLNYLRAGFRQLEEFVSVPEKGLLREQHRILITAAQAKKVNAFHLVAKLASALDAFVPSAPKGQAVILSTQTENNSHIRGLPSLTFNTPKVPSDGWNNVVIPELRPTINVTSNGFRIEANALNLPSGMLEFAFYLLKDGERIAIQWYGDNPGSDFSIPVSPGTYQGIAFLREAGTETYLVMTRSKPLVI